MLDIELVAAVWFSIEQYSTGCSKYVAVVRYKRKKHSTLSYKLVVLHSICLDAKVGFKIFYFKHSPSYTCTCGVI